MVNVDWLLESSVPVHFLHTAVSREWLLQVDFTTLLNLVLTAQSFKTSFYNGLYVGCSNQTKA